MLEEIGEPFDLHVLNSKTGENRQPDYLAINPMGKVPALRHGDVVITELAAICCYLADAFPQAKLNVPLGDPRRGPYLKWLFFNPGALAPAIIDCTFKRVEDAPRQALGYGDFDTTMDVVARAVTPGPFLLGEQFTTADLLIGSSLCWSIKFNLIPRAPGIYGLYRPLRRPAGAQARDGEGRGNRQGATGVVAPVFACPARSRAGRRRAPCSAPFAGQGSATWSARGSNSPVMKSISDLCLVRRL